MSDEFDKQLKYNRANRFMSIKEYMEESDAGDFDSSDITFDVSVTIVEPMSWDVRKGSDDEYYDRFYLYICENVNMVGDEDHEVCDYEGFVYKHYDTLKQFGRDFWNKDVDKMSDDTFVYEWITEIHGFLAGYTSEPIYKDIYNRLKADDEKPPCARYEQFYEQEIKPYIDDLDYSRLEVYEDTIDFELLTPPAGQGRK